MIITAPPATVNEEAARNLGLQLRNAREKSHKSVSDISDALLLSTSQIRGLETFSLEAFYSDRLYAQAAKRYAQLLGVLFDEESFLTGTLLVAEVQAPVMQAVEEQLNTTSGQRRPSLLSRKEILIGGAVVLSAIVLIGLAQLIGSNNKAEVITVAESVKAEPTAPKEELSKAEPQLQPQAQPKSNQLDKKVAFVFSGPSWTQIRFQDGRIIERMYNADEPLVVDPNQVELLTIGNSTVAQMKIGANTASMDAYRKIGSSVARIKGKQLEEAVALANGK